MKCKEFNALIDGYLEGTLAEEIQETFELHYFECDECYAQLKIVERLNSKEVPIVTGSRSTSPAWQWLLNWKPATALAMVLIAAVSFWVIDKDGNLEELLRVSDVPAPVYYKSETRDGSAPPSGVDNAGLFDRAMGHYNQKEYSRTLELLKPVELSASNPKVTFFKGICYLYTGSIDDSIRAFDLIIENMNPSYYDEAIYYKAVALLRIGKKSSALRQLNHLADMLSPFAPKAKEMIQKIKNL